MGTPENRVMYIYLEPTSFVRDDAAILGRHSEVDTFEFGTVSRGKFLFLISRWISQLIWMIRHGSRARMIFGWFVDYHMLLPILVSRIMRKPVIIFVGGFDCFDIPGLRYGIFNSWWRAPIARFIFKRATLLLPVSDKLVLSRNRYTLWPENRAFGLRAEIPNLKTKICPLPTGYDDRQWPLYEGARKRQVCTTGLIDSIRTFRRKGLDIYIETARKMPRITFLIIGVSDRMRDEIERNWNPPDNVIMKGRVDREDLKDIYHDVAVYVQLSRIEGLPNVLCEAMLCGCIPVGSNVFGIPDAIGDTGYIVDEPDPDAVATAIGKALHGDAKKRAKVRERIQEHFSTKSREAFIVDLIAKNSSELS